MRLIIVAWFAFAVAGPALALDSAPVTAPGAVATLISEQDGVTPGKTARVGLRIRMEPGWHIYWRNPGDAGIAPDLAFTLPQGVAASPVAWPTPERFEDGPLVTYGYHGEVLLPVTLTVPAGLTGSLPVDLKASWLICHPVCVPEEGSFHLDLSVGANPADSADRALFQAADAASPRPSSFAARIAPDGVLTVEGAGLGPDRVKQASFFADTEDAIQAAPAQAFEASPDRLSLKLTPGPAFKPAGGLSGLLILTDASGQRTALALDAAPGAAAPAAAGGSLALDLVYALIGGLILNLMPCVFPVLALKAFALVKGGAAGRLALRLQAGAYALGLVLAFLALGGLLVALRAAGESVGWGFQFQSPVFVAATAWLVFLVGLNLSGVFEVTVQPGASIANRLDARALGGSLLTGMLAVLVASPCTAPFMGAALAAALGRPVAETMAIFLALGLGLALPSLLLALVPALGRLLPRPGAWMEVLKQALAFPMYGATVWLIWVASRQSGSDGVLLVGSGLVVLALGAWALGRAERAEGGWPRRAGFGTALAALAVAGWLLVATAQAPATGAVAAAPTDGSEPFSETRLAALRDEGRPVFVDMTAAWCVTCLVNERLALTPEAVKAGFEAHRVAYLKGDWTNGDPAITRFLRAHQADGVPLYLFYRPGNATPVQLPQVLTEGLILDQLAGLKG